MRCRRPTEKATAAAAGGEGGDGEDGVAGRAVARVVAGRRGSSIRFAAGSGVKGAAVGSILLAFLAAVSFRGMRAPLAANATHLSDNLTLIAAARNGTVATGATTVTTTTTTAAETMLFDSNQLSIEDSTTEEQQQTVDIWSERPDTATLTKGFSIPTYLPPYPDFIAADLPQRTTLTMTMATMPHNSRNLNDTSSNLNHQQQQQQQQQPHMRLHAYDSELKAQQMRREKQLAREREQLPRRQLSLPSRNVTVQVGQHAYLPCQLHQHSNKPLSWIRLRDEHIIAVDHTTFINDARFAALLQSAPNNSASNSLLDSNNGSSSSSNISSSGSNSSLRWTLLIKYVSLQDAGWYECQLATEPKMSAKVQLLVITPKTELIGDKQRFVKAGSRVELHCIVRGTLEAPRYIVWYRGEQQVASENEAGGTENDWFTQIDRNIFGSTEHNRNTIGSLVIPVVRKAHSGNYTCEPENSEAVSLQLHVLSGEYSASAIMSTATGLYRHNHGYNSLHQWLIFLLVALHKT